MKLTFILSLALSGFILLTACGQEAVQVQAKTEVAKEAKKVESDAGASEEKEDKIFRLVSRNDLPRKIDFVISVTGGDTFVIDLDDSTGEIVWKGVLPPSAKLVTSMSDVPSGQLVANYRTAYGKTVPGFIAFLPKTTTRVFYEDALPQSIKEFARVKVVEQEWNLASVR